MRVITCKPKTLTLVQAQLAARRSIEVNPQNAAQMKTVELTPLGRRGGPRRLALVVGTRWPRSGQKFTVQFLDQASLALQKLILRHMNAWSRFCNCQFVPTKDIGMVRIARLDSPEESAGYWSYVGTQILGIEDDQPTMNLEGFTARISDAEIRRVVRHETGHTLGFEHEHLREDLVRLIDRKKAIAYFDRECGWTRKDTIEQVLTPLPPKSIHATRQSDPLSIMCYEIPAEITKHGEAIRGGDDIDRQDREFAASIYPKDASAANRGSGAETDGEAKEGRRQVAPPDAEKPNMREPTTPLNGTGETDVLQITIMDEFDPTRELSQQPSLAEETPSATKGPQFARVFATYGGARVTAAMRLRANPGEPSTPFGRIIRVHERIKNYTNHESGSLPTDDEMIEFGKDLFEALFQGDVRRLYDEARARQQNRKLNIIFTSMIPWVAEKPWEFAYDAGRQSFLATEEVHLIRNVLTAVPANWIPPTVDPLRILVAAAQPVGLGTLSIDQEIEIIRRGFRPLEDAQLVETDVLTRATPKAIQAKLSTGKFTIVHIIGHGGFDEKTQEGVLYFEDDQGGKMPLPERSVREILCKRGVSLVFLNSCQSGTGGRHNFNRGVAQSLVAHGLPVVVANQYSVLDASATSFAQQFYWSLANGMSIGQAACEARIGVNSSLQGETIDWAIPVVYARDPEMQLCRSRETPVSSAVSVRPATRRTVERRAVRVAVWDIDNAFPALDKTLQSMNQAQEVFGFELTALSVPIDAWDLEQRAEDGSPYLVADRLAERLQDLTVELGVNILACVTRNWLRDQEWLNLYGWWSTEKRPPVIIFSCAGFDDLAPTGPATDRAIVNVIVSGLGGFLGQAEAHDKGAKNCPLSFDQERNLQILTGKQAFDSKCREKLKKSLSKEQLSALEALLKISF